MREDALLADFVGYSPADGLLAGSAGYWPEDGLQHPSSCAKRSQVTRATRQ